ncbi:kinase-like domain-containing protein [Triangularia verruculosa]|uniref:Kinase-like domain-containing protein n=1 Tax=Triangularia verruculosa TaxID=2587418 RepID=A0AAN6XB75_9PEZI|nr:kinase-like domain-containing protein [Triangularia verruculosa]
MESKPINDTAYNRFITLILFRINSTNWMRRLRKSPWGIVCVSSKRCIKAGAFTTLAEANAMRFVAENTSIPVPKVYCSFKHGDRVYILMERVPGRILSEDWSERSEESKARILDQLRTIASELRHISPPDHITGVANADGGPICDGRLPDGPYWGPFQTIDDFHRKLCGGIGGPEEVDDDLEGKLPGLRELISQYTNLAASQKPVFTHNDFSPNNIMAEGDKVTAIIDWEMAGWMPPYWEYTSTWHVTPRLEFWKHEVDKFLEPFPQELEMEKLRRRYFGEFGVDI